MADISADTPEEIAKGFFGLSRLPLALTVVSFVLTIGLLAVSFSRYSERIGLDSGEKRLWVVGVSALFFAISSGTLLNQIVGRRSQRHTIDDNFSSLTPGEAFVLKWCISLYRRSFVLIPNHPALRGLIHRGILTCHGTVGDDPITLTIRKECWERALEGEMRSEISAEFLSVLHSIPTEQAMRSYLNEHF